MRQWMWVGLLCLSMFNLAEAAGSFTREEIAIMHQAGVKMALEGERQSYVVPADIAPEHLVQTEVLNFVGNSLVVVPEWLAKFTQVRNLNLANTGIKADSALINALSSMPSLEILDLSGNRLFTPGGSSLAAVWGKLQGLRHLNLANTGGSVSDYGSMVALTQLNKLDLSGASLGSDLSGLGLKNLPLERLALARSGVSGAPLSALPTATLGELDLSGNSAMIIEAEYGGMFAFPRLVQFKADDSITLPTELKQKFERIHEAEESKRYTVNIDGTVTDAKNRLMWKRCGEGQSGENCSGMADKYSWDDAMSKFGSTVAFAGYNDWRLPTREELSTLVYCSNSTLQEKARDGSCRGKDNKAEDYQWPTINQIAFPHTAFWYWSSTKHENAAFAWYVDFNTGEVYWDFRDSGLLVRLVRNIQ